MLKQNLLSELQWFRTVILIPLVLARVCGAIIAVSFLAPDEMASYISWSHGFDVDISIWFFLEFAARTALAKPSKSYALSATGVINLLAVIPPTGLAPIEAVRHAARFLMLASAKPLRDAIQQVADAVKKTVAENKQSLGNLLFLVVACTVTGAIMVSVLETGIERPVGWAITTIFPFVGSFAEFSPTTAGGHIVESLLTLVRYAVFAWLGTLILKTWRLALGDTAADSKNESD